MASTLLRSILPAVRRPPPKLMALADSIGDSRFCTGFSRLARPILPRQTPQGSGSNNELLTRSISVPRSYAQLSGPPHHVPPPRKTPQSHGFSYYRLYETGRCQNQEITRRQEAMRHRFRGFHESASHPKADKTEKRRVYSYDNAREFGPGLDFLLSLTLALIYFKVKGKFLLSSSKM
ncbi:hypothetical protein NM208_g10996 [Fusarium decemcellulare]|uniref:Uncharacterized protein n=1 Tax=Fusarium decemcellulare TaxID=57161 RepID=A0ACC1RVZ0_9HYPO|nr:hypothetical protein NM208_g10996 [Fusarium decemcellulare]